MCTVQFFHVMNDKQVQLNNGGVGWAGLGWAGLTHTLQPMGVNCISTPFIRSVCASLSFIVINLSLTFPLLLKVCSVH